MITVGVRVTALRPLDDCLSESRVGVLNIDPVARIDVAIDRHVLKTIDIGSRRGARE